ncbi:MAG: hypothetical protein ACJAUW_000392, partial [Yoonia sp.]
TQDTDLGRQHHWALGRKQPFIRYEAKWRFVLLLRH